MWTWIVILSVILLPDAWARPRLRATGTREVATDDGVTSLVASASEIPALSALLEKAGWTPTPELSGVFQAGSIFEITANEHRLLSDTCIIAVPRESTYTAAELVTSLQAGVSVGGLMGGGSGYAGIVKKVKFGTPIQVSIAGMELDLSKSCIDKLKNLPMSRIQSSYVVQEVLKAQISEETCGKVDARGRFVRLGTIEAEYAAVCAQESLDPVAVGYRTVPLADLLKQLSSADVATPDGSPGVVDSGVGEEKFRWSEIIAQRDAAVLKEAADLEARLSGELDVCLKDQKATILDKAEEDARGVGPVLEDLSVSGKAFGEPEIKRYIDLYTNVTVQCDNALGTRTIRVTAPEVAMMEAWLQAPAVGSDSENHPPPSYQVPLPTQEKKSEPKTNSDSIAGPVILFLSLPSVSFVLLGVGRSFEQNLKKSAYGMSTGEYQATRAKANWAYGTGYVGLGISTVVLFTAF